MLGCSAKHTKGQHLNDELLSAYMDEALSASERALVEQHLATCTHCARDLGLLRQTTALLKELPTVAVPRAFTLREADVMPARRRPSNMFQFLRASTAAVTVMLAAVFAGDIVLRQSVPLTTAPASWAVVQENEMQPVAEPIMPKAASATQVLAALPASKGANDTSVTPEPEEVSSEASGSPEERSSMPQVGSGGGGGMGGMGGGGDTGGTGGGGLVVPATPIPTVLSFGSPTESPPKELAQATEAPVGQETMAEATLTVTEEVQQATTLLMQPTDTPATEPAAGIEVSPTPSVMVVEDLPTVETPVAVATPTESPMPEPTSTALPATPTQPAPTATPVLPQPTPPPATVVAEARQVAPQPTEAIVQPMPLTAQSPAHPLVQVAPLLRIVEIALLFIVLALAGLTLISRPRR